MYISIVINACARSVACNSIQAGCNMQQQHNINVTAAKYWWAWQVAEVANLIWRWKSAGKSKNAAANRLAAGSNILFAINVHCCMPQHREAVTSYVYVCAYVSCMPADFCWHSVTCTGAAMSSYLYLYMCVPVCLYMCVCMCIFSLKKAASIYFTLLLLI